MKSGRKKFVVAIIIIMPCLLLSKLITDYIFFEQSLCYKYRPKHDYYMRNPLPKTQLINYNKIIMNQLVDNIKNGPYNNVYSLTIIQNDSLVIEEYFQYLHRNREFPLSDITGSINSALIGIALEQGKIKGVDEKILDFFPEYSFIGNYDKRKEKITIANLLTHRTGFNWQKPKTSRNYYYSRYRIKYYLDLPMGEIPGINFQFNEGCEVILSSILLKKVKMPLKDWALQNLFYDIGVTHLYWYSHQGVTYMISMRPIDLACFGLLYLRNGRWNDKQVISEEWINLSTKSWAKIENNREIGLNWFRYGENHEVAKHTQINDIYFARGNSNQFLWIIPHLNIVVLINGTKTKNVETSESMLWKYILPAFENGNFLN